MQSIVFSASSAQELQEKLTVWLTQNPNVRIRLATQSEGGRDAAHWTITYVILFE